MIETNPQSAQAGPGINFGHLGIIFFAVVLLLGVSYFEKPELFSFKNNQSAEAASVDPNVPHYYAYVTPAGDLPKPEVLGASTNEGPSVISDDGTVSPVNLGQVLGASTQDVTLSLDSINVNQVPESVKAVTDYFNNSQKIENDSIQSTEIAAALNSGNQDQINIQAKQMTLVRDALQKLPVPAGLVKLHKLKIIQYNTAIQLLQNFTNSNNNPGLVGDTLQQFLKSQQDLDTENIAMAQKYGAIDPFSDLVLNSDGTSAISQETINNFGSSAAATQASPSALTNLNSANTNNAVQ